MQNFGPVLYGIINRISAQSERFKGFLGDDPHHPTCFITIGGEPNLAQVVRLPRLPLLGLRQDGVISDEVLETLTAEVDARLISGEFDLEAHAGE